MGMKTRVDLRKVFVVIPARNEKEHILKVVEDVKKYVSNVIVVDDASTDNTKRLAENAGAIVLRHVINLGKGGAVKTGCDYAVENGAKYVVLIDGDGQHESKAIPLFLRQLNDVDIVFGYRKFSKDMPFMMRYGNFFITRLNRLMFGICVRDSQCGYRAFTSNTYKKIRWQANDYSMESEMIANVGKNKLKYDEVEIKTIYNNNYKGTTPLDGVKIVFNMILWRMRR